MIIESSWPGKEQDIVSVLHSLKKEGNRYGRSQITQRNSNNQNSYKKSMALRIGFGNRKLGSVWKRIRNSVFSWWHIQNSNICQPGNSTSENLLFSFTIKNIK